MSIGVFSMYGKILLAFSPNTLDPVSSFSMNAKIHWRIWRRFCVNKTPPKSLQSPCALKHFWCIFRIRLNTFGVVSEYDKTLLEYSQIRHKELRIRGNKICLVSQSLLTLKKRISKESNGDLLTDLGRTTQLTILFCSNL
jgi:hypothetical protein